MNHGFAVIGAASVMIALSAGMGARQAEYRTLDNRFAAPRYSSLQEWQGRAATLRTHILASAGLVPLPEKRALNATVFGDAERGD